MVVWGSYLALLAPVVGLLPSGLQVTAEPLRLRSGDGARRRRWPPPSPRHRHTGAGLVLAGVALLVAVQAAAVRPAAALGATR